MFLQIAFASTVALTVWSADNSETINWTVNSSKTPGVDQISCFLTSERVSGTNKICTYDCGPSEVVTTVKSHELCPQRINQ